MHRLVLVCIALCSTALVPMPLVAATSIDETIIALERGAMDRWGNGDPFGFLELFAPDVTYFDPGKERRVDGIEAMTAYFAPIKGMVKLDRYEMIAPRVYHGGNVVILSYNLVTYGTAPDGQQLVTRWNTTTAYALVDGSWKIVHNHFSYTKPE
jgi:ketosteroid isomerase-like protein